MSTLLFVLSYILTFIAGAFAWGCLTSVAIAHLARKGKAAFAIYSSKDEKWHVIGRYLRIGQEIHKHIKAMDGKVEYKLLE